MKITCESCGAKYTIADEKVRGRRVKVRCKSCSTAIVVDGSQPLGAYDEATDEATHVMQSPSFDSGAPPADPDLWSVNLSDTDQRDMTTAQIVEGWHSGLITEDAFVWKEGMADWLPVLEVGELALAFGSSQPGSATPAMPTFGQIGGAAPEAARVSPARSQSADLFGAIHTAGSEAEATQAPAPASSPYSEPKPTGARNENSVLFSLDALKAGFGSGPSAASAPKASAPAQPRTSDKADINELMGIGGGGGGPLFGLSANQALLTAPAPPPERTPASVPPAAHSANFGMPARPNRTMLIGIGAGAAALVVVILIVVLHHGSSNKAVAATDQSATPADSAKPSNSAAKPAASAEVAAKPKPSAAPAVSSAPAANLPPFNKGAAIKALGVADKEAKACKKAGGPHGTGKVIITFDTSGKITKAKVEGGHYPGSDVGKCVAAAFLKVQIPAFSGKSITAARHFEIP